MASPEWVEIYESYSSDDLAGEIARLKKLLTDASGFTAMGSGSKNHQQDLGELRSQLSAAVRVQKARTAGPSSGIMDFSGV